jgi:mRNA interferase RelE/StbE
MYRIDISKPAAREIRNLPKSVVARMLPVILSLAEEPRPSGSRKLSGSKEALWRLRVGDYRVIYLVDDGVRLVDVRKLGHRKDIYRK